MSAILPSKILVVRLGAIGDVVNALVFATAIKEACQETEIGWVVHPLARPMVEGHPSVDRVHVWEKGGGISEVRRLLRELRAERYELAVDLQRILKSSALARLSGAKRVLGYDRKRAKELSWLWTKERIAGGAPATHMVDHYLEFVRHLGVEDPQPSHSLPLVEDAEAWSDRLVDELGAAPILVNLGATKPANRWIPERFGELAVTLAAEFDLPVCYTGSSDADREVEARARGISDGEQGVTSLVGKSDLSQFVSLVRRSRLFVGCDTGPMHIAVACGTPVVVLFGPADPRRTGPYRQDGSVVRERPHCAPCNRRTCNQPRHACMEDITVDLVVASVRERLKESST